MLLQNHTMHVEILSTRANIEPFSVVHYYAADLATFAYPIRNNWNERNFCCGGIRWKIAPQWVLNMVLPRPRLEYLLSDNLTLFAGADIKANTFRVSDNFGDSHGDRSLNNAWLTYDEVRAGAGAEWKLNSSISLSIEGGYVPWRQFDFHRTEVRYHYESGAPYGAIWLHGEF